MKGKSKLGQYTSSVARARATLMKNSRRQAPVLRWSWLLSALAAPGRLLRLRQVDRDLIRTTAYLPDKRRLRLGEGSLEQIILEWLVDELDADAVLSRRYPVAVRARGAERRFPRVADGGVHVQYLAAGLGDRNERHAERVSRLRKVGLSVLQDPAARLKLFVSTANRQEPDRQDDQERKKLPHPPLVFAGCKFQGLLVRAGSVSDGPECPSLTLPARKVTSVPVIRRRNHQAIGLGLEQAPGIFVNR